MKQEPESLRGAERQKKWTELIRRLPDPMDQNLFLMQLGMKKPEEPELRRKEWKVPECKVNIWYHLTEENGKLTLHADSDSLIVRGVLFILCDLYSGLDIFKEQLMGIAPLEQIDSNVLYPEVLSGAITKIYKQIAIFQKSKKGS